MPSPGPGEMARGRSPRNSRVTGGQASLVSSAVNMLNTLLGAGVLAMPLVAAHMGIMMAVLVLVWSAIVSGLGLYLQARCARYVPRGGASFFALAKLTYPNAAIVFDAAIVIKCFGVGVSYLIIIGDLMPGVVLGLASHLADALPFLLSRNFWITVFMVPVMMLSFLRRFDSLKYTSVIALLSIGYLVILVVYHFAAEPLQDRSQLRIITWAGPVAALSSFPVIVFAFTCHQNMFSVLNEIQNDSPGTIMGVIVSSVCPACGIYIVVAITGYLTFGNSVGPNIMSQYPNELASTIGKAAIVILEMFSVPLQVHPCRASLDAVLRWRPAQFHRPRNQSSSPARQALLRNAATTPPRIDHVPKAISEGRFAILTCVILVMGYTTALSTHNLDRVLAWVGSTGSTSISFILPGLFYYKISRPDSLSHQCLLKGDDDAAESTSESDGGSADAVSAASVSNIASATSGRLRRRWRWDLEHLDHAVLRKLALGLTIYGFAVMTVCLSVNAIFSVSE